MKKKNKKKLKKKKNKSSILKKSKKNKLKNQLGSKKILNQNLNLILNLTFLQLIDSFLNFFKKLMKK